MLIFSILISAKMFAMNDFIEKGADIVKIPQAFQFTEGPVWTKRKTLLFTDIPANKIYEWDGKTTTVFREPTNNANGLTFDRAGNLYVCEHGSRSVTVTGKDGKSMPLATLFNGKKLNSPNDVAVHPRGGTALVTDPSYGIRPEQAELDHKSVYMIDLKTKAVTQYYKGKNMPNGVLFSPKGDFVYVADSGAGILEKFTFDAKPAGAPVWTVPAPGADGIRVDVTGNVWAACADGVRVYNSDGKLLQTIKFPEQPANLCFGEDGKTLFVTARKGVYYVRVNVKGVMPGF